MNRPIFICPACKSPLTRGLKTYTCVNNHTYDVSKEGYVNLLLANQKQSREPGDSKEMINARKSFLNKGYYKPLADKVTSSINRYCDKPRPVPLTILDAGCGEGYYTDFISRNIISDNPLSVYGLDISREGIKSAAKRNSEIFFAVAGIYNMPVTDQSVNILTNIFAPFNEAEFGRVIDDDGIIISVTPGADHLYELKKNIYDEVYLNDEVLESTGKLYISETERIRYEFTISANYDIASLLKMTPYYYKSSHERIESFLSSAEEIKITADFLIRTFRKIC